MVRFAVLPRRKGKAESPYRRARAGSCQTKFPLRVNLQEVLSLSNSAALNTRCHPTRIGRPPKKDYSDLRQSVGSIRSESASVIGATQTTSHWPPIATS